MPFDQHPATTTLMFVSLILMCGIPLASWLTLEKAENPTAAKQWFGGLALNVLTIGPLGFTLASVLLFVCVTRGFGSRQPLRDAAIGGAFALVAYLGFAKTLNINIGAGLIENGIEWLIATVRGR
jgi:putative tricarboxylic transport membrane protein